MKHKLLPICLLLMGVCCFLSCSPDMENRFDESTSIRIDKEMARYDQLLQAPQYGWAMEYYAGGVDQIYGGYALTARFEKNDRVVFQSSFSKDVTKQASSIYELKKDRGLTLCFTTYNELFHQFSDPDSNEGKGEGTGYAGDYEFIFESGNESEIILTGKKYRTTIRMYPLKEPANEYLSKAQNARYEYENIMGVMGLKGKFAGKEITGNLVSPQRFRIVQGEEQTEFSFMFTDKGFKLYSPISLGGTIVDSLIWKPEDKVLESVDGNTRIEMDINPLALYPNELAGSYTFSYTNGKTSDVIIEHKGKNDFVMRGLPFDIKMVYNRAKGALEIYPQQVLADPDVRLWIWDTKHGGWLYSGTSGAALQTVWNGDKENFELTFTGNDFNWIADGIRQIPNAFYLRDIKNKKGYTGFGEFRFYDLKLTKKK